MQAVSRQSYLAALERLDALLTGPDGRSLGSEQLLTIADQLLGVARLLAGQVQLRRALADPSRPGEDRAGLLRGLLGRQVDEHTREILDTLVAGRWSAASELLDASEQLAVQALLASSERAGALGEVEDELFRFGQLVANDPELAAALGDRRVPVEQRGSLVDTLLTGKATDTTIRAVKIALGGLGGRRFEPGLTRLIELAAQRMDRSVAYVTVATALTETEERRLGTALSARYGRDVSLKTTVDPRVLGGVRVRVGADLYDGTVAHRLTQARNALASG